jgi:methyl-accepting chemotaxis protein
MAKHYANQAQQTNTLTARVGKMVDNGGNAVLRMNYTIKNIEKSFDEIAGAIKTIDQIAFQRNLYALNIIDEIALQTNLLASEATVKADRVMDVSKGFALVAEEVRNLAAHSAEAAKNITAIMEESASTGVDITHEVTKVLEEVMRNFGKTTGLVAKIATTLHEQNGHVKQTDIPLSRGMT